MAGAKSALVRQRKRKVAAMRTAMALFEKQMSSKRELRQLFKNERPRRGLMQLMVGTSER